MNLRLPDLEDGRVYRQQQVAEYIGFQDGSSDFNVVFSHFPRDLKTFESAVVSPERVGEEMFLQYRTFALSAFIAQIRRLETLFVPLEKDLSRIETIEEKLLSGDCVFPVFIQHNDPQRRIIEGMHRCVALFRLQSPVLPTFVTGYREWFDGVPGDMLSETPS